MYDIWYHPLLLALRNPRTLGRPFPGYASPNVTPSIGEVSQIITGNIVVNCPVDPVLQESLEEDFWAVMVLLQRG